MAFLKEPAYGGPQTWGQLCGPAQPQVDLQGLLAPPWGDAIRAAVLYERSNPNWADDPQFAEGPVGQVTGFLEKQGFGSFKAQAAATEDAAKAGQTQMQGGCLPQGQVIGASTDEPARQGSPKAIQQIIMGDVPAHLQCLIRHSKMEVREKASMSEAFSAVLGKEIELGNKYRILAEGGAEELFFAAEETSCCMRQAKLCAPDCAPWKLNILYTQGATPQLVYRMEREWTCTCCCFNRPVLTVTDVTTDQKIGSIKDPFSCCNLTFHIRDPKDDDVLRAKGGCCQWGFCCPLPCGPCAQVNIPVCDVATGSQVGHLQKRVPGCCKWLFAPDVDNYKIDFGGVLDPQRKAMLLGLAIFTDFRYFNENRNADNGGVAGAVVDKA